MGTTWSTRARRTSTAARSGRARGGRSRRHRWAEPARARREERRSVHSEAHEESELSCDQDLRDAKSVCWCAQECTTTAAYYDGSQDLSAHDPDKCREHWCGHHDGDCCGDDHSTWCADGYTLVRGNEGDGCWPGRHGYRCLPPDATPAPTSSATPVPTQHVVLIDGTTPPEIVRAYNATAYDVCDAWGECPLNRAVCESDPELRDNCEGASYDPWRPDCRYASCGQCNCDWWDNSGADECCSAHCWQGEGWHGRHPAGHRTRDAEATATTASRLAGGCGDRAAAPGCPRRAARGQIRCVAVIAARRRAVDATLADESAVGRPRHFWRRPAALLGRGRRGQTCNGSPLQRARPCCGARGPILALRRASGPSNAARPPRAEDHAGRGTAGTWAARRRRATRCAATPPRGPSSSRAIRNGTGGGARRGATIRTSPSGRRSRSRASSRGRTARTRARASLRSRASLKRGCGRGGPLGPFPARGVAGQRELLRPRRGRAPTRRRLRRHRGLGGGAANTGKFGAGLRDERRRARRAPLGNEVTSCRQDLPGTPTLNEQVRDHDGPRHRSRCWWSCVVPPLTARCASHDWCPWYGPRRARSNVAGSRAREVPGPRRRSNRCDAGASGARPAAGAASGRSCAPSSRPRRRARPAPARGRRDAGHGDGRAGPARRLPGGGAGGPAGATFAVAVPVTEQPVAAAAAAARRRARGRGAAAIRPAAG